VQQKVRVKVETAELRDAKKPLDDLEEELRRSAGCPAGGASRRLTRSGARAVVHLRSPSTYCMP
jgi:hypothetical protein